MGWFDLSRSGRHYAPLIPGSMAQLQGRVAACLDAHGIAPTPSLQRECAAFVLWSVHVGIVNATTTEPDRWLSRWILNRQIDRIDPEGELRALYRRRCTEALGASPNIYLYQARESAMPRLPVTAASAKLFLRKVADIRLSIHSPAVADMLAILSDAFWAWVGRMNPRVRTSFP